MIVATQNEEPSVNDGSPDDDIPADIAIDDDPTLRSRMGRYLGGVRRQRNVSQRTLAKQLGMSRPHLSNIEMGRSRPAWRSLREMAAYFGLGVRELIEQVQREMPAPRISEQELAQFAGKAVAPPWPTTPPPSSIGANAPQILMDDERFVVDMFRALDADSRRTIVRQIRQLVHERLEKIIDS